MYNKVIELCAALNKLSKDELEENGIGAIIIFALSSDFNSVSFSKGALPDILALIGSAISNISKASGIPIKELLEMIEENEALLEAGRKMKEGD